MTQLSMTFSVTGRVAGVDEVGRGPLAGPVVTAAVVLPADLDLTGLTDSKALAAARREALAVEIREHALDWSLGRAEVAEIDELNILNATMLAMQRAVAGLRRVPDHVLVDGNRCPVMPCTVEPIVGGDGRVPAISAASILAKMARDEEMIAMDAVYPGYGFAAHKGYGTAVHREALSRLGATPIHRRSFAPVATAVQATDSAVREAP